jgi:aminoglycoside phosphotransferase (APT) family kinase protein
MHADELDIDVPLVTQLLASQFPEWADLRVEPVEPRGTDNALFRLGDELVARLPRRALNVEGLEKERAWLTRIAPRLPVPIPEPRADGKPDASFPFPWLVCTWIDGRPATRENIGDGLARELGQFILALEAIDPGGAPPPGPHNSHRGEPLARRDRQTRASIAAVAGRYDTRSLTGVWESALAAPEWDGRPVWIHGDLDSRNLLVDEDGRLCGVIDFGCLGAGDPAYDAMAAWKLFDPGARERFRAELGFDDPAWERGRGLAVSQAVMALSYYTPETNAVLVEEAERWLAAVLHPSE